MATFSDARIIYGLTGVATPTSTNASGSITVGVGQTATAITGADVVYSVRAILAGTSDLLVLDGAEGTTSSSTAWVAGTAQVETATAAGTITGTGNATITVTAAGMTGSPKAISVAVTSGDTDAVWAGKVRTALAADADVSALFTVGGTTTAITLTRKPTATYTVPDGTLNLYAANDATLNIAIANDTCTGITEAATSANTTAGVVSSGAKVYDGDGKDVEGVDIPTIGTVNAMLVENDAQVDFTIASTSEFLVLEAGARLPWYKPGAGALAAMTFGANVGSTDITVTIVGTSA